MTEKTLPSNDASPAAKSLVERLRDVPQNELAWAIAEEALEEAFEDGYLRGRADGKAAP